MPGTSLAKKLVIKPHYRIVLLNAPRGYRELVGELPDGVTVATDGDGLFDMVQAFAEQRLRRLRRWRSRRSSRMDCYGSAIPRRPGRSRRTSRER
ncbi:MAG TPA: hypothetical protein VGT44_15820 [Ktedonobacteraceae bacterium]|nr:hypothetical protein [Ktedonobacteraceae bacterium]